MVTAPDEDFATFLEFGDIQLDFPPFDGVMHDGRAPQQTVDTDVTIDTPMENAPAMADFALGHMPQQQDQSISIPLMSGYNGGLGQLYNMQTSRGQLQRNQHSQAHMKTHHPYPPGMVPPTPNSIELHGGMPGYYHAAVHQQPNVYEHYQRSQRDQVSPVQAYIYCLDDIDWRDR